MSALAITAAHLVAFPVRYAVGRWYNIPTNTLLAFNAADIGLSFLVKSIIGGYCEVRKLNLTLNQEATLGIVCRTCVIIPSALYVTSKLTDPMPILCAVMTNLASFITIYALVTLAEWSQRKNE